MAKLPDIQYLSPTESLGRQDIGLPGRLARAQIAQIGAVTDVVMDFGETIMQQQVGEGVAGAQWELGQLKTTLMRDRVTDVDKFDLASGVDYKATDVHGEPVQSVSSHTVMENVWAEGVKKIVGKYTEGMSGGQRRQVREKLAGSVSKMGGMVSGQAHKWRMDEINAVTEEQVHKLRNSASFETKDEVKQQISSTYNDMIRSGFMGAEEGLAKIRGQRSKVDYHVTSRLIADGGQDELDQAEEMLARPAGDFGLELTLEQRKALYTQMDQRQKRLESNRSKTETLERRRTANEIIIDIHENGPKEWNEVRRLARDLEPADARAVATLNNTKLTAEDEAVGDSDEAILAGLESDILAAGMTRLGEVSPNAMRDALINKISMSLEDHREGKPGITPTDANLLYGRVNTAMEKAMKPMGYNDAVEQLAGYITKGSVANLGLNNNGPQALKFYEAKRDLINAIRSGETRDPLTWVELNYENYLGGTTVANMKKADIAVAERFAVPSEAGGAAAAAGMPTNISATLENAKASYKAGNISRETYQMTVDYWRDQRAAHMEMLRRRAEREQ